MSDRDTSDNRFAAMGAELRKDIERYAVFNQKKLFIQIATNQGIWVTAHYRFSRWIDLHLHIPVVRQIGKAICFVVRQLFKLWLNCEFPSAAEIGEGLFIPHPYSIVIHQDARLGRNCNLGHEVTIGWGGRKEKSGVPRLGDRVFVAPGAKLFGKITIGNDVAIGANAVVNKHLPDNAVAVGVPAKIVSYDGSSDFVILNESDREDSEIADNATPAQPSLVYSRPTRKSG